MLPRSKNEHSAGIKVSASTNDPPRASITVSAWCNIFPAMPDSNRRATMAMIKHAKKHWRANLFARRDNSVHALFCR